MASRKIFGHRDGFSQDSLMALNDYTGNNPLFTGGVLLYLLNKAQAPLSRDLLSWFRIRENRTWPISIASVFFGLSILKQASDWLSWKARNNGVTDQYDWTREVVVITGASSGIGARVAEMLCAKGCKVAGLDIQQPLKTPPANMKFYVADVTSRESLKKAHVQIQKDLGAVTVLCNNAGIGNGAPILEHTDNLINKVMAINCVSHYYTVQEFMPGMVERNHGHIITIASMASLVSPVGLSSYGMSKAAAMAFHESLTMEVKYVHNTPKIRTSIIHPLWTKTPLIEGHMNEKNKGPKVMHVDTVAEAIANVILSGESHTVMLPRSVTIGAALRGMPDWFKLGVHSATAAEVSRFDTEGAMAASGPRLHM
ncbi:hypothetical protein BCR37DRAFT_370937 [Protomyces lactucae-debilis]|uniref:Short-chain dehydrogenase/reductase 3 n=1 Tax=Protomyces lactucae-debilis TaxID=2754530 RepID=A0A1Y2F1M0_PROLT|nr:uncharacterized protein BCR37DRAFT_370937 [Protomyces lactucae-debilis]ORY77733.1 hypothetical protein BCR37DRAFT_370937 [Protomyces lactucae-debilis]